MKDKWQESSYKLGSLSLKYVCFIALPQFSIICLITARLVVERMFSIASMFSEYHHGSLGRVIVSFAGFGVHLANEEVIGIYETRM